VLHRYTFDTGFLTLALTNRLPEKWFSPWKEVIKREGIGYIIEPVVMETYYQLMAKGMSKEKARDSIMKIKSLDSMQILALDDNDAFRAGVHHMTFHELSFVDCFILAIADKLHLKLYTTDSSLKMCAKKINIECDYLPI